MLKTHMKIHKTQTTSKEECKCAASKDYNDSLNEIRILRKNLENAKNEIKTLKEYHQLKQGESKTQSQEKVNIPTETSRQSVITYRCTTCSFITKSTATLGYHKESHKDIKCEICSSVFESPGSLNQHMLKEHKERMSQLNCNSCSFQSNDKK